MRDRRRPAQHRARFDNNAMDAFSYFATILGMPRFICGDLRGIKVGLVPKR